MVIAAVISYYSDSKGLKYRMQVSVKQDFPHYFHTQSYRIGK